MEEMEFNPKYRLTLALDSMFKLRSILEYMMRDTGMSITSFYRENITITVKDPATGYPSYENLVISTIVYYHLPKFFNLGKMLVDLTDYDKIIDLCYEEYERKTSWEEVSVEIPVIQEKHEKDRIL